MRLPRRSPLTATVTAATMLLLAATTAASEARRRVSPPRIEEGADNPSIDGVLDEPVWSTAALLEDFSRTAPVFEGQPAHATQVRILYTERALFLGFECEEPRDDVYVALTPRDTDPAGDTVSIELDTFGDAQRAYRFVVSAAGSQMDERLVTGLDPDRSWDTTFDADVALQPDGYVVEVRIPFRDLRFPDRTDQRWGLQITRRFWAAQETGAWSPIDPEEQNALSQYGLLELETIASGAHLQLLPSVTFTGVDAAEDPFRCDYDAGVGDFTVCGVDGDYGIGARYLFGPAMALDAVFNPDFSQVEADPGRITLNERFALGLEERRPFFLENRDVFELRLPLVYTRSIARPLAGARLTGNVGEATRLGVLVTHDIDPPDSLLDSGFAMPRDEADRSTVEATTGVARVQQTVLAASRVGLILADREYSGADRGFSRLTGIDGRLELGDRWSLDGLVAGTWSSDLHSQDRVDVAYDLGALWQREHGSLYFQDTWIGSDTRAEMGFLNRAGYHRIGGQFELYLRSARPGFRYVSPAVQAWLYHDTQTGDLIEGTFSGSLSWSFDDRTYARLFGGVSHEVLEETAFRYAYGSFSVGSSRLPWLSPDLTISLGEAILRDEPHWVEGAPVLGNSLDVSASLRSRPVPGLDLWGSFWMRALYRDRFGERLEAQSVLRLGSTGLFSNDFNTRFIVEYLDAATELSFDALLSYLPSPGTVIFLGYRDTESVAERWNLVSRGVFAKLSVLWTI